MARRNRNGYRLRDASGTPLGTWGPLGWGYTGAELLLDAAFPPSDWGPWELDATVWVLRSSDGYEVDLEKCLDSAQVLDWIMQVNSHGPENGTLAGLVRALDDVLKPQKGMCSWGVPKRFTNAEIRRRARAAHAEREQAISIYGPPEPEDFLETRKTGVLY